MTRWARGSSPEAAPTVNNPIAFERPGARKSTVERVPFGVADLIARAATMSRARLPVVYPAWPDDDDVHASSRLISHMVSCISHGQLLAAEVIVQTFTRHQLVMRATLDQPTLLEHHNDVGAAHRAKPMGDHKRRAPL
jgi:hypothetical protein